MRIKSCSCRGEGRPGRSETPFFVCSCLEFLSFCLIPSPETFQPPSYVCLCPPAIPTNGLCISSCPGSGEVLVERQMSGGAEH
ncbi:hypothetical protein XELAEV_18021879mg [Xenopus laevis]|uniref:Uncharacterized protein n=1 Tax=Xenopus laevis TaxID=8355 RepID=A0A974D3A4_XENLA|nr:hypothetical protein XELAEV_18021879mg [Xenopus laevis]